MLQIAFWGVHMGRALADPRKGFSSGPGPGRTPFWGQFLPKTLMKHVSKCILGAFSWLEPWPARWKGLFFEQMFFLNKCFFVNVQKKRLICTNKLPSPI